jgi:hypothetical protein
VIQDQKKDAESIQSHKLVLEKLPNAEETITITIRDCTMGSHEGKAEGSTLACDKRKWKPTAVD